MKKVKRHSIAEKLNDPELRALFDQPLGTPVSLTREQAIAIVQADIGGRPDLPSGREYVKRVAKIWGGLLPRE
ncbi:MAG: hypothetical protein GEU75_12185 [Dehalococcoidia bacterium]|nr:hypothetical protein [Dehalococcoidia bacterium]